MATPKVGQYKFQRKRNAWAIYQIECISNGFMSSRFVKSVPSFEVALQETYRLNGWNQPKNIVRKY